MTQTATAPPQARPTARHRAPVPVVVLLERERARREQGPPRGAHRAAPNVADGAVPLPNPPGWAAAALGYDPTDVDDATAGADL